MKFFLEVLEALAEVPAGNPDLRNYVPRGLQPGMNGKVWVGLFKDWSPTEAGVVTCVALDANTFSVKGHIRAFGVDKSFAVTLKVTGANTGLVIDNETGAQQDAILGPGGSLTITLRNGISIEMYPYRSEVRFWITGLPQLPYRASVSLAF